MTLSINSKAIIQVNNIIRTGYLNSKGGKFPLQKSFFHLFYRVADTKKIIISPIIANSEILKLQTVS